MKNLLIMVLMLSSVVSVQATVATGTVAQIACYGKEVQSSRDCTPANWAIINFTEFPDVPNLIITDASLFPEFQITDTINVIYNQNYILRDLKIGFSPLD